ncbi:MAG: glycosyltransferase family 4 protein [bacterium]
MSEAAVHNCAKRVLFLTLFGDLRRGGQHSLLLLASRMDRSRYEPTVAVPEEGALAEALREHGIETHVFGSWPHPLRQAPWVTLEAAFRLRQLIRQLRPDVIHTDAPRLAHLAVLAGWDIRRVMHLRVSTFDGFSDTLLALHSHAMIAISQGVADRFLRYPERIRDKIHIVYNGVDLDRFRPRIQKECASLRLELGLSKKDRVVTMLAAFVPFKRHLFIAQAWAEVMRRIPARLILAGSGDETLQQQVVERLTQLGIRESVLILPPTSRPEELLGCADVNILASIRDEGLGRVIPEAAACGVPSIAADAPGVRETILPGLTGVLLPADSTPERWGEEIAALLKDKKRRGQLSASALTFARDRFSAGHYCREVMKVYDQVLEREKG